MNTERKPLIGLNMSNIMEEGNTPVMKINDDYVDAVSAAGGIPVLIPQLRSESDTRSALSACDGFLLIGGYDYDPLRWGDTERHPSVHLCDVRRQEFDMTLIHLLLESSMPVLGICGGHQLINLGARGTLYQDIFSDPDFTKALPHSSPKHRMTHDVRITPGSLLHGITGREILAVNSTHHMAIKRLGDKLCVTARSDDGCVEAIECTDPDRFILGVQWHPEAVTQFREHLELFRALVSESGRKRAFAHSINS